MRSFDEAYPPNIITAREGFLRNVWAGREKTAYSCYASEPGYRQVEDSNEMVEKAIDNILAGADLPGYNIPRFMADFGTVSVPACWGGEVISSSSGKKYIKPLITNVDEAYKVKPGDPSEGDTAKALVLWEKVSGRLGTNRLPCSTVDIQGPLNTAALLWEQSDFMVALYEYPDAVHRLLEQITEQIIGMISAAIKRTGGRITPLWPYIWLPSDIGVGITEDYMPLISPALYKEFGIPYLERISAAFGGVFIHCCGKYDHQIENLLKSKVNILGLEFAYPHMEPKTLFNAFGSSTVFVPNRSAQGEALIPDAAEYYCYIKEKRLAETRLWFVLFPEHGNLQRQVEIIESMM